MDSTPPSNRIKWASRLTRAGNIRSESEEKTPRHPSLQLPPPSSSPNRTPKSLNLSPNPANPLPLHELLLLSPSPAKRSKTRLADRLEMVEEFIVEPAAAGSRRRCKSRVSSQLGCSSPRNARRSRRRVELESREEKELGMAEESGRARKRRHSGRTRKEKPSLAVSSLPPSYPSPKIEGGDGIDLDRIGQMLKDLLLWKDVSKSALWFGLGSLCFFSCCFSKGISFSIISAISQLGLLLLGVSFFSNSYFLRGNMELRRDYKLKEEDILRAARLVLPAANLAISKTRELLSGDASMTLKVAPLFLVGAEYGHLINLRRLCAIVFIVSFTIPKLYSCYFTQINKRAEDLKWGMLEAWRACSYKKIVAASLVTAFWNLSTVKTRIFAAFMALVIFRYRQLPEAKLERGEAGDEKVLQQQELALVLAEESNAQSPSGRVQLS